MRVDGVISSLVSKMRVFISKKITYKFKKMASTIKKTLTSEKERERERVSV